MKILDAICHDKSSFYSQHSLRIGNNQTVGMIILGAQHMTY